MDKLYFINNCGCHDTTSGIARISDEDFPKFKTIIENLNKNSIYACMPRIRIYKIPDDAIVKIDNPDDYDYYYDYYYDYEYLYLDNEIYALKREFYQDEMVLVIGEE